ncbi:hypothetical protein [Deinococcus arenicola]|uniref:Uncharacterized protein n=1 Tax=Deinococcus arenicola TaxID=2994950 RepID=A0ABU4DV02_9DEIO|nr:hypothetical protein [Deinococcus sp. ZS9-10]MDV6376241.1 hypothetical protein [Deinococcus sp. ZS9-10]
MTEVQTFVALKAFRFGTTALQIGDPVPVEAGRDYRLMQRLGQIAPASVTVPAGLQETELLTPYKAGDTVVFVADDGTYTFVQFLDALEAPEEVQDGMNLEDGDMVASVAFPDDPDNAVFVPLASLLPEQPTGRMLGVLQAQTRLLASQLQTHDDLLRKAGEQRDEAQKLTTEALETGQKLAEQLLAARTELETLRAAPTIPPDAIRRLVDIKGVGERLAPVILAALTAQPEPSEPPTPDPTPEG